jgi:hypothetical protein
MDGQVAEPDVDHRGAAAEWRLGKWGAKFLDSIASLMAFSYGRSFGWSDQRTAGAMLLQRSHGGPEGGRSASLRG